MEFQEITIGGLDCIEIPGDPTKGTVVLLHGYGSTNNDLAPLSRVCPQMRWLFPAGPEKIVFGPDYTGYGWFPVDVMKLRAALEEKRFDTIANALSKELPAASKRLEQFLQALDTPLEKVILGGFSQGAVVSTDCALTLKENIQGLLILSGTLTDEERWAQLVNQHKELPFFMSHGKHDDVLPYELAARLEKLLQKGGLKGKLHSFNAGHEVPFSLLLELQPFLQSIIS